MSLVDLFLPASWAEPTQPPQPIGWSSTPQGHEAVRARAYEMARSEMPEWSTRVEVMTAADEIFEYLRCGTKPQTKPETKPS